MEKTYPYIKEKLWNFCFFHEVIDKTEKTKALLTKAGDELLTKVIHLVEKLLDRAIFGEKRWENSIQVFYKKMLCTISISLSPENVDKFYC